jgi:hypothetical protein
LTGTQPVQENAGDAPSPPSARRGPLGRAVSPAWVVFILYLLWLGILLPHSHDGRDFIHEGSKYILRGHGSSLIRVDAYVRSLPNPGGYDGQYSYYIALDPLRAGPYLDVAPYRYTRILYPMLARILALGQANAIPYAMLGINFAALVLGTLAVASWLRRKGLSVWFSLIFGLYPGLLLGVKNDLTEPLCYALVALGVYLFDFGGRLRLTWSALAFALALLTRETSIVFPLLFGVGLAVGWQAETIAGSRLRMAAVFTGMALGPFMAYKLFLTVALGSAGLESNLIELKPFGGILAYYPWQGPQMEEIRTVFFPAMICACYGIWALRRRLLMPQVWVLLANVLLFVVLLAPASAYDLTDAGRITDGVVLAAVFCIPVLDTLTGRNRTWLWTSAAFWLALMPFWLVVPIVDSFIHHAS